MRQIVESSAGTPKTGVSAPQGRKFGILVGSGGHPSMEEGVGGSLKVPNGKQYPVMVPNGKHPLWAITEGNHAEDHGILL